MPLPTFAGLVEEALDQIPAEFRRRMTNVAIVIEPEPPRGLDLLGLHETGLPHGLPDRITIYEGPHRRSTRSLTALRQLVAETVFHEVGHYFGLNEREAQRLERRIAANRSEFVRRRRRAQRQ